jgi:hypothetical protein
VIDPSQPWTGRGPEQGGLGGLDHPSVASARFSERQTAAAAEVLLIKTDCARLIELLHEALLRKQDAVVSLRGARERAETDPLGMSSELAAACRLLQQRSEQVRQLTEESLRYAQQASRTLDTAHGDLAVLADRVRRAQPAPPRHDTPDGRTSRPGDC